ncbi:hypothetical protein D6D00_04991 [Aureobasidium pullulans]|nr:hypothetical protein D6D00_04991 [Aureobasidium pullulans]
MANAVTTRRVTWAVPLVQQPVIHVPHHAGLHHRPTPEFSSRDVQKPSEDRRSAADSLRNNIRRVPPTTPSKQPGVRRDDAMNDNDHTATPSHQEDDTTSAPLRQADDDRDSAIDATDQHFESPQQQDGTNTGGNQAPPRYSQRKEEERTNYEHSCNERRDNENLVLQHDEYLFDPNDFLWAAACKFADVLESREPEITSDYYFSTSDVLSRQFLQVRDLCASPSCRGTKGGAETLALCLWLGRSPNLKGASTDMEKKFVIREVRTMRRRSRMDHVQIHADSLEQGFFIAKVDGKDLNEEPLESCRLLQDVQGPKPTERIAIPLRPRANDVGAAWVVKKKGGVWA